MIIGCKIVYQANGKIINNFIKFDVDYYKRISRMYIMLLTKHDFFIINDETKSS